MNINREVFVYSDSSDYMETEYIQAFKDVGAKLTKGDVSDLMDLMTSQGSSVLQLDTETNVTDFYCDRELYVVQIGSTNMKEQHIFDIEDLSPGSELMDLLKSLLSGETTFLAHNAVFEYIVIHKHFGIDIKNFKDTLLASRIITSGLDMKKGYHGLANLLESGFGLDMSKEEQTTFDGNKMTVNQLVYAHYDVMYLQKLLNALMKPMTKWDLTKVFNLENKTIRPVGDCTINGFLVNKEALAENVVNYGIRAKTSKDEMIGAIVGEQREEIKSGLAILKVIQPKDEVVINWNSSTQKKAILNHLHPDENITSSAKSVLIKLEKNLDNPKFITMLLNSNTDDLENTLISRHKQFLKDNNMFLEKGQLNLNVNSNAQLLAVFQLWYPGLGSVGVKALKKLKHPVINAYKVYSKANKLVSSFGEKMYDYIESDGRIHSSFNQLVPSGSRMSSYRPNMQQAPSTEEFRRIYIPQPGWKLVDTDYASAELYLAAYLSKDEGMMSSIAKGYDLHSASAFQIFGQGWLDAGGSSEPVGKPATKEANAMRKKSKGASFSILYGTGVVSFSEANGMSLSEGKVVLKAYFAAYPKLVAFFKKSGEDALTFNYVREPYFKRVRFFNKPTNGMEVSHNKNAGMNYKPQAANGGLTKYAMCMIKKYIEVNDVAYKVRMIISIHDQIVCEAREDYAQEWGEIQTHLMEKAALYLIPEGTLTADTDILDHWTKG
jgi:DNA polymerase I-like protein with 3'-5' exonuclease and polymerase domains